MLLAISMMIKYNENLNEAQGTQSNEDHPTPGPTVQNNRPSSVDRWWCYYHG